MGNHGHVKRASQLSRDCGFESTSPAFAPLACGSETETLRYSPHMGIDGENISPEGVEHDTERSLPSHARKAGQITFSVVVRHGLEPMQAENSFSRLDGAKNCLNLSCLRRREPCLVDERLQLVGWSVTYCTPFGERVAEARVRPDVLDLLRHPGQDEEDQIIERVNRIEVTGKTVSGPQPLLQCSHPTVSIRCSVCGGRAQHGGMVREFVRCSRSSAPVE